MHTRERALRRQHDVTTQPLSPTPASSTAVPPCAVSGAESQLHQRGVRGRLLPVGVLGVTASPSIAAPAITSPSHVDSWSQRGLERPPFEEHDIVEAGRAAALLCRPDAAELFQRHMASTLERLQRTIHAQLEVVEVGGHHAPSLDQVTLPSCSSNAPVSHSAELVLPGSVGVDSR